MTKPHGLHTARKLRYHRQSQRWHDKDYKKAHLGTRWKANPFGGASHAKGIVVEKVKNAGLLPNSACSRWASRRSSLTRPFASVCACS